LDEDMQMLFHVISSLKNRKKKYGKMEEDDGKRKKKWGKWFINSDQVHQRANKAASLLTESIPF
jgi:hypothetical protein